MKKTLILTHADGSQSKITTPTHVGRTPALHWYGDPKEPPVQFMQLQSTLALDCPSISRNHCAIYAKGNHYFVLDLGSRHGTFLNGTRLPAMEEHRLRQNDVLGLADYQTTVEVYPKSAAYFISDATDVPHLGELVNSLIDGGVDMTHTLVNTTPKADFLKSLAYEATELGPTPTLVVYVVGDGKYPVLGNEILTPAELYRSIEGINGFKQVIVDKCEPSEFINAPLPRNTFTIACTTQASPAIRIFLKEYFRSIHNPPIAEFKERLDRVPGVLGKYRQTKTGTVLCLPTDSGTLVR